MPFFGVLMGLVIDGDACRRRLLLPALDEMIAAARGPRMPMERPARSRVATSRTLADACILCTDARHVGDRLGESWTALQRETAIQRGWGDCYGHCLVATGRADVMLDPRMNPWDCAALVPILQEAGGRFTDWRGRVAIDGGDAVSTNGRCTRASSRAWPAPYRDL